MGELGPLPSTYDLLQQRVSREPSLTPKFAGCAVRASRLADPDDQALAGLCGFRRDVAGMGHDERRRHQYHCRALVREKTRARPELGVERRQRRRVVIAPVFVLAISRFGFAAGLDTVAAVMLAFLSRSRCWCFGRDVRMSMTRRTFVQASIAPPTRPRRGLMRSQSFASRQCYAPAPSSRPRSHSRSPRLRLCRRDEPLRGGNIKDVMLCYPA